MKKLTVLLFSLSFALILPVLSFARPEGLTAAVPARAAVHFTCGEMQTGTLGSFPETHTYTVYLQGNKGVAFMAGNAVISSVSVYAPNGSLVGNIPKLSGTTKFYGVLTTPNQSGNYTISVYGFGGTYYLNCLTGQGTTANANTAYNSSDAVIYARQYAAEGTHNPDFPTFSKDCTNFVSQCVYDGGMPMLVGDTDAYWYLYNVNQRSPSWAGADYFMRHWAKVRSSGYYGRAREVRIYTKDYILQNRSAVGSFIRPGDIVQYLRPADSTAYHSHIISEKYNAASLMLFYCSHTTDTLNGDWFIYLNESVDPKAWVVVIRIGN